MKLGVPSLSASPIVSLSFAGLQKPPPEDDDENNEIEIILFVDDDNPCRFPVKLQM